MDLIRITAYAGDIKSLINAVIIPVLFAAAFLYFFYGIYKYFILGATEETSKGEGRQFLLWSIIGFVVIFSVWGLVNVGIGLFNLGGQDAPTAPIFKTP